MGVASSVLTYQLPVNKQATNKEIVKEEIGLFPFKKGCGFVVFLCDELLL